MEFSLECGVEEDDEDVEEVEEDEEVKFIPDNSGGLVAVFWPLKLFLHTGHVSCWRKLKKNIYTISSNRNRCRASHTY